MLAKTPPGRNSNSPVSRFHTETPVTSEGRRSGVNWTRCQVPPIERAIALASEVLPTPGTSSIRRWPEASRQTSARWTASRLPWMTCSTLSTRARNSGSTRASTARAVGGRFEQARVPAGSVRVVPPVPLPPVIGLPADGRECTGSPSDARPASAGMAELRSRRYRRRRSAVTVRRRGRAPGSGCRPAGALAREPGLWPTALGQAGRLARPGWWRRAPFLPVPDAGYVRFRLDTQYGAAGRPDPEDLVTYLRWCRGADRATGRCIDIWPGRIGGGLEAWEER